MVKIIEMKSRMVFVRVWEEGQLENYCLMDIELSVFQDEKSYGDGWWQWLHNIMNV